jgi:predicted outer membrane repeat protein
MKKIIVSFLIAHCAFLIAQDSPGQIIHVPADQPTIQAGIDVATDGDTVLVADGTYLENINFMGKAITVASQFLIDADTNHINNTVIDGSQPANPDYGSTVSFVNSEDTTSILCGLTITGGSGMPESSYGARVGGGIVCFEAGAKITHNKITGNAVIEPNYAFGGGIACVKESGNYWLVLEYNIIRDNHTSVTTSWATGGGCEIWINARICNNIIEYNSTNSTSGNAAGGGIYISPPTAAPLDTLYFHNNTIQYNSATSNMGGSGGGMIAAYMHASFTSNTFKYNSINCMSTNVAYGSTAGGLGVFDSESYVADNEFSYNVLTGPETDGAGLQFYYPLQTDCIHNTITHNIVNADSVWFGAGCAYFFPQADGKLADNVFSYNSGPVEPIGAGGGIALLDAMEVRIIVDANRFLNNIAYHGGGFYERTSWNTYITNNIFVENETYRGGGIGMYHPAIEDNSQYISSRDYYPMIINNSFCENSASSDGGAIRYQGDQNIPEIYNCIFWENTATSGRDVRNWGTEALVVSYSDLNTNYIAGNWTGEANIDADPLFTGNCHITAASPCRDAGMQSFQTPMFDYEAEFRPDPVGLVVDMGADEFYDVPEIPLALYPEEIGNDYFVAIWTHSLWAIGYSLDVAYDEDFTELVPGYDNLDVGKDTFALVANLYEEIYYYRVRAYNAQWVSDNSNIINLLMGINTPEVPGSQFAVRSYPNPFSNVTTIEFKLPEELDVTFKLYDLTGREVRSLVIGHLEKGRHMVTLQAGKLGHGIYLLRLTANREPRTVSCKLVVQ